MRALYCMVGLVFAAACGAASADGFAAWLADTQRVMGAGRVLTRQTSVSTDKKVVSQFQTQQAQAAAQAEMYTQAQVRQVVNDFGPNGQMVDPCYQMSMAVATTGAQVKTGTSAQRAASLVYQAGSDGSVNAGGLGGALGMTKPKVGYGYAATVKDRVDRHLTRYCSVAESAAGLCSLNANGMQAGDSDFSLHLQPGKTFGWDQTEAAADFVKTVAPVHRVAVDPACSTVECLSARAELRKQEASMSMARFSMLQFVEAHSTQLAGDAKKPAGGQ